MLDKSQISRSSSPPVKENSATLGLELVPNQEVPVDVFEEEPYHGALLNCENMVLTSHIGSLAKESRQRMELEAAENLLRGLTEAGVIENG